MKRFILKNITKIVSLIMIFVLSVPMFGCVANYPKGAPELKDEKEMFIGAYCAPQPTDEQYKWVAESGITHMFVGGGDYLTNWGYGYDDEEYYSLPFDYAAKYGVKCVMHVKDTSYKVMGELLEEVKARENFEGFLVYDEPPATQYGRLASDYKRYKVEVPNQPYYVNLLPTYSQKEQLGKKKTGEYYTYEEYLEEYKNKVLKKYDANYRVLMCDHYPLKEGGITNDWLYNLELLRTAADEVNGEVYLFLQSQGFLGEWRQPYSVAEMTFQMYVNMAYGARGLAHYPYQTPESSDEKRNPASILPDGTKSTMYPLVKAMNTELKKFDGVYLDFDWKAVVAKAGKRNIDKTNLNFEKCSNLQESYGLLKKVECKYDAIVGCFENEQGYQGFLAVNFNDPKKELKNEVTLYFKKADKAIVYLDGEPKTFDVKDGKLTLDLGLGEGAFVVPYCE